MELTEMEAALTEMEDEAHRLSRCQLRSRDGARFALLLRVAAPQMRARIAALASGQPDPLASFPMPKA